MENAEMAASATQFQTEEPTPAYIKLDYSLESPVERTELVKKIIEVTPQENLTPSYLKALTDYIIVSTEKKGKQNKSVLTENRMVTLNKRETSFEGLVGRLENGEDGIYSMIANDKNIIFTPKVSITEEDIETIPGMKELRKAIEKLEEDFKHTRGKAAYIIKKNIIDLRQDQYVLKNIFKKPMFCTKIVKSLAKVDLSEKVYLTEDNEVKSTGLINLYTPAHISLLLCNYSKIKEETWDCLNNDLRWMMLDLEELVDETFKEKFPLYYDLIIYKIDGLQNIQIQERLNDTYSIKHSVEYISSLWRNKIPKMIAETAANKWLEWHFTFEEEGKWKRCSRCGQVKLANNRFFSKNSTSKDGWYSICKECRNKKK